ncbi:GNAT family N-acetyltransferase [Nonomuraea sp. NPDC000554]|uniref:GNAT family N-acetyltransferase n=1 Tax=Nonomuraea sp. NPDC000554 TaxID=3154259 RepID=UPI0033300D5A
MDDVPLPVTVRSYSPADRDAVAALAPRLTEGVASWRTPEAVARVVHGWVEHSVTRSGTGGAAVFVAELSGEIVGFVSVTEQAHFTGELDGYIGELAVSSRHEGRGIGKQLVEAAEAWARSRGRARVGLETGAANARARRFYASLGYQEEGVRLSRPVDS